MNVVEKSTGTNGDEHRRRVRCRRWLPVGLLVASVSGGTGGTPVTGLGPLRADTSAMAAPVSAAGGDEPSAHSIGTRGLPPDPPDAPPRTRHAFASDGTPLHWQPIHGTIDGSLWRDALSPSPAVPAEERSGGELSEGERFPGAFHGTGFPMLERVVRLPEERQRRWEPLISWSEPAGAGEGAAVPLPHVRCMGLSPPAVARRAGRVEEAVLALSIEHGVSASLVKALIAAESCFDHEAISSAGAIGLMQLMPETAAWLGADDPADIAENLRVGIGYLASLQERFGDTELALAAYNAGPGNVSRHGGIPPFAETRAYVRKVMAFHRRYVAATEMASR